MTSTGDRREGFYALYLERCVLHRRIAELSNRKEVDLGPLEKRETEINKQLAAAGIGRTQQRRIARQRAERRGDGLEQDPPAGTNLDAIRLWARGEASRCENAIAIRQTQGQDRVVYVVKHKYHDAGWGPAPTMGAPGLGRRR